MTTGAIACASVSCAAEAYRCQVLQHQPEFGHAFIGACACPAQIVQVEQRVPFASLLEQVGDLLGDRTLARPVDHGDQDALGPVRVHSPRLGRHRTMLTLPTTADVRAFGR